MRRTCEDRHYMGPATGRPVGNVERHRSETCATRVRGSCLVAQVSDLCAYFVASHTLTDLSAEPETTTDPSALITTAFTAAVWPFSTATDFPATGSHTRTVPSSAALTSRFPSSSLNARAFTAPVWPGSAAVSLPVVPSRRRTVPSLPATAIRFP